MLPLSETRCFRTQIPSDFRKVSGPRFDGFSQRGQLGLDLRLPCFACGGSKAKACHIPTHFGMLHESIFFRNALPYRSQTPP